MWQVKLRDCDPSFACPNLSALEMSNAHTIKRCRLHNCPVYFPLPVKHSASVGAYTYCFVNSEKADFNRLIFLATVETRVVTIAAARGRQRTQHSTTHTTLLHRFNSRPQNSTPATRTLLYRTECPRTRSDEIEKQVVKVS